MNKIRVQVVREKRDNKLVSMIRQYPYTKHSGQDGIVIDREHGRTKDQDYVVNRAKRIAKIIGCKIDINMSIRCIAEQYQQECECDRCKKWRNNSGGSDEKSD